MFLEVLASVEDKLGLPLAVTRGKMLEVILVSPLQAQNTPPGLLMSREKVWVSQTSKSTSSQLVNPGRPFLVLNIEKIMMDTRNF